MSEGPRKNIAERERQEGEERDEVNNRMLEEGREEGKDEERRGL